MIYKFLKWVVGSLTCFSENVVSPHTHIVPFSSQKVCDDVDYLRSEEFSDRVVLLDKTWDFCYFENGLINNSFNTATASFKQIEVPFSWEEAGFESKNYIESYPFSYSKSNIAEGKKKSSSVGIYRQKVKIFDLTKQYFLNFDRVCGSFEVFINGQYVGFSSLGYGEFDVTDKIVSGENEIVVGVKKWTVASFADGADRFAETGIVGDVYFVERSGLYLADADFRSSLEEGIYKGKVTAVLSAEKPDSSCTITLVKDGEEIFSVKNEAKKQIVYEFSGEFVPYINENPVLYDLYITLEELGSVVECCRFKVGFGKLEFADGIIGYNGKPLKINGVNYNAYANKYGKPMTFTDFEEDFRTLRNYGFNSICAKVYLPYSVRRLAKVYGLYIVDPVPAKASKELIGKKKHNYVALDTKFHDLVVARAVATYCKGKMDCNVIARYFENANISAPNYAAAVSALKELSDASVLIGGSQDDIAVVINPSVDEFIDEINKVSASRPVYLADYSQSFGIGNATLAEFAELIENTPCAVGGCVSNFVDEYVEGLQTRDGGMFTYDRRPYAAAYSHRFVTRPIKVKMAGEDKIEIFNNSYFDDTSLLDIMVVVVKNGKTVSRSKLNVTVEPRESRIFDVFVGHIDGDMHLNIECYERGSDFLISVEQLSVHGDLVGIKDVGGKFLSVGEKFDVVEVRFDCGSVRFSKVTGTIIGYNIKGKEILNPIASRNGGACFNTKVNRPFVRNILNGKYNIATYSAADFHMDKYPDRVVIDILQEVKFGKKSVYTVNDKYTVFASGIIELHSSIIPTKKAPGTLDCFGKQLRFYPGFEHITYYGKGDGDNYIDLSVHALTGLYDTTATAMSTACSFGQECGNRTGVHYVIVRDDEGDGIMVAPMEDPMQIRVTTVSDEEIVASYKEKKAPAKSGVYVNVDSVVSGYGSGVGEKPLAKYTLKSGEQNLDIKVYPVYGEHETYGLE